jgi:hypothetical protein
MAAFVRTQIDAVLVDGYVTLPSDWADLDSKIFRAVNGDRGGTWAPSAPIQFPAGNFQVTGPIKVYAGGELRGDGTGTAFVMAGATEWPLFAEGHTFRKRAIVQSTLRRQATPQTDWILDRASQSIRSFAIAKQPTDGSAITGAAPWNMELRVHDGARLARVRFSIRVPTSRPALPVNMPRMRVLRVDPSGNVAPMKSRASGADANGFVSVPKPSTAAAWYAGGEAQTFIYECDQNNVIDVSLYQYFVEVYEESSYILPVPKFKLDGVTVREIKVAVGAVSTAPAAGSLSGLLTVGGVVTSVGMRVLIKDGVAGSSANAFGNGIWIASAGAWTRAADLTAVADWTPNFLIPFGRSLYEPVSPYPGKVTANGANTDDPIFFRTATPTGNIYHSVVPEFEDIIDMRFQ